ncbi:MAG: hypothetical protein H6724_10205 [Sandaracinus sp.]|nr:hypothetical protein [Sandaracinus sp.]
MRSLGDALRAAEAGDSTARQLVARVTRHAISASPVASSSTLEAGEAWLVGVQGTHGEIWRLRPERPDSIRGSAPLVGDALRAANLVSWLVRRDVPSFGRPVPRTRWEALPVSPVAEPGRAVALDGASYGLALFGAAASRELQLPPPSDAVSLGVVEVDGRVGHVDGLVEKLDVLRAWAPGLRRVFVAASQADEVRRRLVGVEVIPVTTVAEVLDRSFPNLEDQLVARWANAPEARRRAVWLLSRSALHGDSTFGWGGVARTARVLLDSGATSEEERSRLQLAYAIAMRHQTNEGVLEWPTDARLAELPRPLRLSLVAHVVQSQADGGNDGIEATLARAEAYVAPRLERHAEDLKLLGALGRLAAFVDLERACRYLEEAIEGWQAIERIEETSHSLCEALRLRGLAGGSDAPLRRVAAELLVVPGVSAETGAYVRCALGVASALRGEYEAALEELVDAELWHAAPKHLRARRLRWLARTFDALGERERAAECGRQLAELDSTSSVLWSLSCAEPGDVENWVERLRAEPSAAAIVRRLAVHPQRREPLHAWLLDAYPY